MDLAAVMLLFVAGALMLISLSYWTRLRGTEPGPRTRVAMAAMTGFALGFLSLFLFLIPFVVFPLAMAGVLVAKWRSSGRLAELGAFLVAGAGFWVLELGSARLNDLSDTAVTEPAWTPIPLAVASALMVFGATLFVGERLRSRP